MLSDKDQHDLGYALALLARTSLAARFTDVLGVPIQRGLQRLPAGWSEVASRATRRALYKALNVAVSTLHQNGSGASRNLLHKAAVTAAGFGGGAAGIYTAAAEIPVSTAIMLRSIADIARSEGEKIKTVEAKLACIEVFALGGRTRRDPEGMTYFSVRASLAKATSEAATFVAERGVVKEGAPALVRLITKIAARFEVTVSEKLAAQAVPVFGAISGAAINWMFIDHFQQIARGHFIVRRLERTYGPETVRAAADTQQRFWARVERRPA